jgi:hypothetical protein
MAWNSVSRINAHSPATFREYLHNREIAWTYISGWQDAKGESIDPCWVFSELYAKCFVMMRTDHKFSAPSLLGARDNFLAGRPIDMDDWQLHRAYVENMERTDQTTY